MVEAAKAERLALVVFAGEAFIALPLTQDRDAVLTYLRALDSDTISVKGSELGRALAAAGRTFDPRSSRPRTVLLLSDGEDFGPVPDAEIAELHALGARVIAVGYGTEQGGAVPGQAALAEALRAGETTLSQRNDGTAASGSRPRPTARTSARSRSARPRPSSCQRRIRRARLPRASPRAIHSRPVLVAAALALAAELWLSGGAFALRARRAPAPAVWQRRRAQALAAAVAALAIGALGVGGLIAQGDAALDDGHADEALALYRQAEESRPDDARLEIRIGNALFRLGRTDQAVRRVPGRAAHGRTPTTPRRASRRASTWATRWSRRSTSRRRATRTGRRCSPSPNERRGEVELRVRGEADPGASAGSAARPEHRAQEGERLGRPGRPESAGAAQRAAAREGLTRRARGRALARHARRADLGGAAPAGVERDRRQGPRAAGREDVVSGPRAIAAAVSIAAVLALAGAARAGDAEPISVRVSLDRDSVRVHEQVLLSVEVTHPVDARATWEPPPLDGFWVERLGMRALPDAPNGLHRTEFRRALFPTRPGLLEIGTSKLVIDALDGGRDRDLPVPGTSIRVEPLPDGVPPDVLVGQLELHARRRRPGAARQVRHADHRASPARPTCGTRRPPDVETLVGPDVEVFPEPAKLSIGENAGRATTRRQFRYALVPARAGRLAIPSLEIPYFDPARGAVVTAKSERSRSTWSKARRRTSRVSPAAPRRLTRAPGSSALALRAGRGRGTRRRHLRAPASSAQSTAGRRRSGIRQAFDAARDARGTREFHGAPRARGAGRIGVQHRLDALRAHEAPSSPRRSTTAKRSTA